MDTSKKKNLFNSWLEADAAEKKARMAHIDAARALVDRIKISCGWPCADEDPYFVTINAGGTNVMIELQPCDDPLHCYPPPFRVHYASLIDLEP